MPGKSDRPRLLDNTPATQWVTSQERYINIPLEIKDLSNSRRGSSKGDHLRSLESNHSKIEGYKINLIFLLGCHYFLFVIFD